MQTLRTFLLVYLTLLVCFRLRFLKEMPKPKTGKTDVLSKYERQKLQRLYTQGGAAHWSVRNRKQARSLPVSKVRQFLHSGTSFTEITLSLLAFARFRKKWYMDVAFADKQAEKITGLKYVLVRQDLFHRAIFEKDWTKNPENCSLIFNNEKQKRIDSNKPRSTKKKTKIGGEFPENCGAEKVQVYWTTGETEAAFTDRIIWSLKKNLTVRWKSMNKN